MLKQCGAQAKILLERVPVLELRTERGGWEIWSKIIEDDMKEVNGGTTLATKKVGENAEQAAAGRVG